MTKRRPRVKRKPQLHSQKVDLTLNVSSSVSSSVDSYFPFFSLPAELRLRIYRLLLPYNTHISFRIFPEYSPDKNAVFWVPSLSAPHYSILNIKIPLHLFTLSRSFHAELDDVLYGSNTFHFYVNHFSAYGLYDRVNTFFRLPEGTVRHLQRVEFLIQDDVRKATHFAQMRNVVRDLANTLGASNVMRLKHLKVEFETGIWEWKYRLGPWPHFNVVPWVREREFSNEFIRFEDDSVISRAQFVLEPLAKLRGIEKVEIRGDVESWFARALASVMMRGAGDEVEVLKKVAYKEHILVKRRPGKKRQKIEAVVSEKQFWMPEFEWGEIRKAVGEGVEEQEGGASRRKVH
ncbi:hypothetical protein K432DRAFT_409391 [Lepidopterella palustris CBS 459.81]|uniref:F-box domain-containing protein n=1 Tax=Lepidopterella palustris CBS 459.81 TaxID=1314670 RepID=A0A8E2JA49_9PEZI|nr:hypothetical protein K432DRAFT_409391 [Lepidopterella palustris CBS 459.81]